ncbi:MAG TPA: hypothetical protein VE155_12715 [Pseudonocardiaceae bacterium]|nr:hypothetical protein [Pseudonocardiaceae bacterium]
MPWINALIMLVIGIVLVALDSLFPYPLSTIAYVVGIILAIVGFIFLIVGLVRGYGTRV